MYWRIRLEEPARGVDDPGTWSEFMAWFPDDAPCLAYLERLRWPDGFVCPRCGHTREWRRSGQRWLCAGCRRETSATAGTIFDRIRSPLTQWFAAAWHLCSTKNGASALGLQKLLGLGSYETRVGVAPQAAPSEVIPGRDLLRGEVEVDETYGGGKEPGLRGGRARGKKELVAIAVECRGRGSGRVRLARIPDLSRASLHGFIQTHIEPAAVILTDTWQGIHRYRRGCLWPQKGIDPGLQRDCLRPTATCPSGRLATQTLVAVYSPGIRSARAARLLSRRVHL